MNNLDHSSATMNNLRESFEADYKDVLNFELGAAGGYKNFMTFVAFRAYQSAHISAVKQCAEIVRDDDAMLRSKFFEKYDCMSVEQAILALLPTNESEVNNER